MINHPLLINTFCPTQHLIVLNELLELFHQNILSIHLNELLHCRRENHFGLSSDLLPDQELQIAGDILHIWILNAVIYGLIFIIFQLLNGDDDVYVF